MFKWSTTGYFKTRQKSHNSNRRGERDRTWAIVRNRRRYPGDRLATVHSILAYLSLRWRLLGDPPERAPANRRNREFKVRRGGGRDRRRWHALKQQKCQLRTYRSNQPERKRRKGQRQERKVWKIKRWPTQTRKVARKIQGPIERQVSRKVEGQVGQTRSLRSGPVRQVSTRSVRSLWPVWSLRKTWQTWERSEGERRQRSFKRC